MLLKKSYAAPPRTSSARYNLSQCRRVVEETSAVNLPGMDRERPNWRRKLAREAI